MSGYWTSTVIESTPTSTSTPSSTSTSTSTCPSASYWSLISASIFLGNVVRLVMKRWQRRWQKQQHTLPPLPSAIATSPSSHSLPPIDIVGHRGMGILAPENSMIAFHRALTLPMHSIETDLWLTLDGYVVIEHGTMDPDDIDFIPSLTWSELHTMKPHVPLLQDLLQLLVDHPDSRMNVCLELKYIQWLEPKNMQKVLDAIVASGIRNRHERIMFSSFVHANLNTLRSLDPHYPRGALFNETNRELPPVDEMIQMLESCRAHEAHIRYNHITPTIVTQLQSHSYRVMAWYGGNVDDSEEELLTCIYAGVSKLCTNRPDRLAWLCGWVPKSAVQPAEQLHEQAPS